MLIKQFYMTYNAKNSGLFHVVPQFLKMSEILAGQVVAWGVALTKTAPSSSSLLHQQASKPLAHWWDDESGYIHFYLPFGYLT